MSNICRFIEAHDSYVLRDAEVKRGQSVQRVLRDEIV